MKQRNPVVVFILSLITFGIYDIYWLVTTKKELNQRTSVHTPTIWLLFSPIVVWIVALIVLFASSSAHTSGSYGGTQNVSGTAAIGFLIVWAIAILIIIPITFFWFFKFSKAVNEYTHGKMSTGVTFLLLWLLHLLGVAIVQDTFNDMIASGGNGQGVMPSAPVQPNNPMSNPTTNMVQPMVSTQPVNSPQNPQSIIQPGEAGSSFVAPAPGGAITDITAPTPPAPPQPPSSPSQPTPPTPTNPTI